MNSEPKPIRLGIIGLGLITQSVHLPSLLGPLRRQFKVVNVCDLSAGLAAAIGAELGARHGSDAAAVIAGPDVDAVLICTPGAHSVIARQALEAGKHVFAEKPYSYDPEIAARDAAYAAEHGLVLQVGYMKMYEPAIAEARSRMDAIGPLRLVRMTVLHPSDARQTEDLPIKRFSDVSQDVLNHARTQNQVEVKAAISGQPGVDPVLFRNVLHGSVCHQTAVLRALFPGASSSALMAHQDRPGSERDEPPKLQVVGRIDNGPDWALSWNWLTHFPEYQEWVEIYGDRGSLRIDLPPPYKKGQLATLTTTIVGPGGETLVERWERQGSNAFARELEAFGASITTGASVLSDAAGAGRDAQLLRDIASLLA
ncbi:Gfo/Idh/MocA family protein [Devosia naphthalenivorans]|uniref:Gfo/Idh/MocA family protein n=1 Tax=Devosia naphthalenivorans TaxID=2082392 RepID=UPI000D397AB5|nr:Gfo/Idh/MocA family oxidoreductase [Devosia naphthalenivorans]